MANAKKTTKVITPAVEAEVITLELDAEEAQILRAVIGNISSGDTQDNKNLRLKADRIFYALIDAGVDCRDKHIRTSRTVTLSSGPDRSW